MTSRHEARSVASPGARGHVAFAARTIGVRGAVAVLRRPGLWVTAFRVGARLAPTRWWTRAPYLPVPDPSYLRFRMVTAYGGDGDTSIDPHDLIDYLDWVRDWPSSVRDTE